MTMISSTPCKRLSNATNVSEDLGIQQRFPAGFVASDGPSIRTWRRTQRFKSSRLILAFAPPPNDFLPPDAIQSIVVFTGDAEFKTTIPDGVLTLAGFLAYVERDATEVMSANRVQFCVARLGTARLSITKTTDVEHVQQVRSTYGNDA